MAEEYTVSHTGSVLGEDHVELSQNQTDPVRRTEVLELECPDKFEGLEFVAAEHPVRFVPRTLEEETGDGATTEFALDANLQPIAGESDIEEQNYPVVEAVEVGGEELEIADVDYTADTVTLEEAPADGTDIKFYPVLTKGTVKWGGKNALGQDIGTLYPWGFPMFRFHDMDQIRAGREITMEGRAEWSHNETLELRLESEEPIVWEDEDYPDAYVSEIEIDLRIYL